MVGQRMFILKKLTKMIFKINCNFTVQLYVVQHNHYSDSLCILPQGDYDLLLPRLCNAITLLHLCEEGLLPV